MINNEIKTILSMGEHPNLLVSTMPRRFLRVNRRTNSTKSLNDLRGFFLKMRIKFSQIMADCTVVPVKSLSFESIFFKIKENVRVIPNPVDTPKLNIKGFNSRKIFFI